MRDNDTTGQLLQFEGQVAVVTGGAGGLGRSQCIELARRGARVVVNDLGGSPLGGGADPTLAEDVAAEIRTQGGAAVASADSVATPEGAQNIVAAALDSWGRLDAIITNAAITKARHFEDLTIEEWDEVTRINVRGVFCSVQAAYRAMIRSGGGQIVTLTSPAGMCGGFGMSSYATSKAAVIGLTRSIAWEGGRYGVKANAVAPGAFDTRMAAASLSEDAAFVGRPSELQFASDMAYLPRVTSSRVTPLVVALAHQSCPFSGEIFGAFGGRFSRFFMSETVGVVPDLEPDAEDVAASWEGIRAAEAGARELDEELVGWMHRSGASLLELAEEPIRP